MLRFLQQFLDLIFPQPYQAPPPHHEISAREFNRRVGKMRELGAPYGCGANFKKLTLVHATGTPQTILDVHARLRDDPNAGT